MSCQVLTAMGDQSRAEAKTQEAVGLATIHPELWFENSKTDFTSREERPAWRPSMDKEGYADPIMVFGQLTPAIKPKMTPQWMPSFFFSRSALRLNSQWRFALVSPGSTVAVRAQAGHEHSRNQGRCKQCLADRFISQSQYDEAINAILTDDRRGLGPIRGIDPSKGT